MTYEVATMPIALINTSVIKEVRIGVRIEDREIWQKEDVDRTKPQRVLPLLVEILSKQSLSLQDLVGIEVHPGPGSYTGLRVGFTVANALGYLLGIPVNGKITKKVATPIYE